MSQLKSIETLKNYPPLKNQYVFAGLYINELIYKLFQPNEPQEKLFTIYQNTLENLTNQKTLKQSIRLFEHHLQKQLGYELNTHVLEQTNHTWFSFHPESGLSPCTENTKSAIHRDTLKKIERSDFSDNQTQQTSKAIFAELVKHLLGENSIFITKMMPKE